MLLLYRKEKQSFMIGDNEMKVLSIEPDAKMVVFEYLDKVYELSSGCHIRIGNTEIYLLSINSFVVGDYSEPVVANFGFKSVDRIIRKEILESWNENHVRKN